MKGIIIKIKFINLNNQLNQKASEVRLYLYNNKINIVNN